LPKNILDEVQDAARQAAAQEDDVTVHGCAAGGVQPAPEPGAGILDVELQGRGMNGQVGAREVGGIAIGFGVQDSMPLASNRSRGAEAGMGLSERRGEAHGVPLVDRDVVVRTRLKRRQRGPVGTGGGQGYESHGKAVPSDLAEQSEAPGAVDAQIDDRGIERSVTESFASLRGGTRDLEPRGSISDMQNLHCDPEYRLVSVDGLTESVVERCGST
jgi:hypothetical protein